ncbi:MAG: TIGR04282 family arsenosugar biosynthesis glycosyltransferase [Paracoccaceae bacterium]
MVKEPRAGRVKTRLGHDIGMTAAAWWFRHQTQALIRRLRDPRWQLILAVSPDNQGLTSRNWPADLPRLPQGTGNLGTRMKRIFDGAPPGPVLIIGADIPGIQKPHIARAFCALGHSDAVIGPAPDGGYWLIGLKRQRPAPPALFNNVQWSSENALSDTVSTLKHHRIAYTDMLRDVDTAADLQPPRFPRDAPAAPC